MGRAGDGLLEKNSIGDKELRILCSYQISDQPMARVHRFLRPEDLFESTTRLLVASQARDSQPSLSHKYRLSH